MRLEDAMMDDEGLELDKQISLRERSMPAHMKRRREVRSKLIFLNSAVALIVIMVVLIVKVVSLQSSASPKVKSASVAKSDTVAEKNKNTGEKDIREEEASPTPAPTAAAVSGADKWIRKDLNKNKPMIALTFDDGPYTPVTKRILAALEKHQSKATFFWVCNRIPRYEESVRQAYNQGCQVASHTYEHVILTELKKKKSIVAQVDKANREVKRVIGCEVTALRPPGGAVNSKVRKSVKLPMICWDVDSEDWKSRNAKKILQRCKSVKDGDIILMHDLYPATAKAVEKLVPQLKKKGFQLVTIDELFYYKGITLKAGCVYYSGQ